MVCEVQRAAVGCGGLSARGVRGLGESIWWMWRVHVDRLVWSDGSDQSGWLSILREERT